MVLNYVDARNEGHIRDGDVVMLTTNGAGFTWGAALIRQ
jgi:3-oxoacyl-[acyl-carrier-protein] synthase III